MIVYATLRTLHAREEFTAYVMPLNLLRLASGGVGAFDHRMDSVYNRADDQTPRPHRTDRTTEPWTTCVIGCSAEDGNEDALDY